MKRKNWGLGILIALVFLGTIACGQEAKEVETKEVEAKGQETIEQKKENKEATNSEIKEIEGFGSISRFSDLTNEMSEYINEGSEQIDDLAFLGDSMAFMLPTMGIIDAELDYAMHGTVDSWKDERSEMPSGAGEYESSLEKQGEIYQFIHKNHWKERNETDTLSVRYNPKERIVDVQKDSDGEAGDAVKTQFYIDEKGALYMTHGKYSGTNKWAEKLVVYYDKKTVQFSRKTRIQEDTVILPFDMTAQIPSSFEELAENMEEGSQFIYDGDTASYTAETK